MQYTSQENISLSKVGPENLTPLFLWIYLPLSPGQRWKTCLGGMCSLLSLRALFLGRLSFSLPRLSAQVSRLGFPDCKRPLLSVLFFRHYTRAFALRRAFHKIIPVKRRLASRPTASAMLHSSLLVIRHSSLISFVPSSGAAPVKTQRKTPPRRTAASPRRGPQ